MKFSVFQVSRKGGRKNNEDRMGYCYTRASVAVILADGMGGHPDGEVAAQLALESVAKLFQQEACPELSDVEAFLSNAMLQAHHHILQYGIEQAMADSPRTTLVLAVVQGGALHWTHCGDSRLYLVRQGRLIARTRDHSLVEQQHDKPVKTGPANRNVLFTCLGSPANPVFSVNVSVDLRHGDRVMLCSDGLWAALTDETIVRELSSKPVDVAVPDLVEQALRVSGNASDNVTCLALSWDTPDQIDTSDSNDEQETVTGGFFATTVQLGWSETEAEAEELDDAAIERSIAEINEAIRRSAKKTS